MLSEHSYPSFNFGRPFSWIIRLFRHGRNTLSANRLVEEQMDDAAQTDTQLVLLLEHGSFVWRDSRIKIEKQSYETSQLNKWVK